MKKSFSYTLFFILLIAIDIGSKEFFKNAFITSGNTVSLIETNFLDIKNLCNDGMSFGIFSSMNKYYLQLLIGIIFIALIIYIYPIIKTDNKKVYFGLMIMSGAMSNLIDRILNGCVYDFIDLHFYSYHWYVFNIADAYITIGAIFFILNFQEEPKEEIKQN